MPHILFVASTYSHIAQFHRPYLQGFQQMGWTVHVACGGAPMDIPEADRLIGLPFEKQMLSLRNLSAVKALRHLMNETEYTLISCHTSLASFFTRLAVWNRKKRPLIVCTAHGYLFGPHINGIKGMVLQGAERLVSSVTDLLMTMNEWDTQYANLHNLGKRVVEIPGMGLNPNMLHVVSHEERQQLRHLWGVEDGDVLLLYAAEFSERKSQSVLLHALTQLPNWVKLALPGQGAQFEQCQVLAKELGIAHRVIFPGQVGQMEQWYGAADIAVSSSRSEGLPFNLMEAMYYGLPIVASRVKGHTDLLLSTEAGRLYPYGDWQACASEIHALLDAPEKCTQLGMRAQQAVSAYLLEQVYPYVMAQYHTLLPLEQRELVEQGASQ